MMYMYTYVNGVHHIYACMCARVYLCACVYMYMCKYASI